MHKKSIQLSQNLHIHPQSCSYVHTTWMFCSVGWINVCGGEDPATVWSGLLSTVLSHTPRLLNETGLLPSLDSDEYIWKSSCACHRCLSFYRSVSTWNEFFQKLFIPSCFCYYGLNTCHYDQVLDLIARRVLCMYLGCSLFTCLNGNDQVLFPSNYMLMAIFSWRLTYQPAMLCPLSNVITCQVLLQPLSMNSFVHAGMFITLILQLFRYISSNPFGYHTHGVS